MSTQPIQNRLLDRRALLLAQPRKRQPYAFDQGVFARAASQQGGSADTKRIGEPKKVIQLGERFASLDFRDIGARHTHAFGQTSLGESSQLADFPDAPSDVMLRAVQFGLGLCLLGYPGWAGLFRLRKEQLFAHSAAAVRVGKLDALATVAAHDEAGVRGKARKNCRHLGDSCTAEQ